MLTQEEREEITRELAHYPTKRAACVEALMIVQRRRGWVSDEVLRAVADFVDIPPADLDRLATFYNLIFRKAVGTHVILVCDSITCWLMGSDRITAHLRHRLGIDLGQTTQDGRFIILPNVCLGACDRAPVMMIGEELYESVTEADVDRVLNARERPARTDI